MGRTLKRVPLDFKWPFDKTWYGYINPYIAHECVCCNQTGLNDATRKLQEDWYSFDKIKWVYLENGRRYNDLAWQYHITDIEVKALIDKGRLYDFTRVPINEQQQADLKAKGGGWLPYDNGRIPTAEEVNNWNRSGMGHDVINMQICVKARAKHLGVYGLCDYCKGDGYFFQTPKLKKLHENWEKIDPPSGPGFQLWQTTSEGSPISPVFESLDLLCIWLEGSGASTFGNSTATKEQWKQMLSDDNVHHREGNNIFM